MARVAVITGALKGLGFQASLELAGRDYTTVVTGRDADRGARAVAKLAGLGLAADFLPLDVASEQSIDSFTTAVLQRYGRVDVLVNNAGILPDSPDHTPDEPLADQAARIESAFRTNALGAFLLCQRLIPGMVGNGYGRVVNVSSGMGQLSDMDGGYPAYRISKTALNAVTRIWAAQTRGQNVLVNSVCPGWVRTDMGGPNADRSLEEGIDTIVWLATLPDGSPSGGFFRDRKPIPW